MRFVRFAVVAVFFIFSLVSAVGVSAGEGPVNVFAAASTTDAVTEICRLYEAAGSGRAVPVFASSSTLAKQIENGAPAQVYISANVKWMDYLAERKMIVPDSRIDLLGNRIVLIAPADSKLEIEIKPGFSLLPVLGDGRLSMGDPDHVPAGMYGKEALKKLGAWNEVESRVAGAKDVRAALALVERGEAPLGQVYSTDAAISKKVRVVGVFPESSHPPIVYPVALVQGGDSPEARTFFEFLKGPKAKAVFEERGFTVR